MRHRIRYAAWGVAAILASGCAAAPADIRPDEVVAVERSALDRWYRGDPQGFVDISAPGITYFDPFVAQRVDGLATMKATLAAITGKVKADRYEMLEPRVDGRGDVAVLTYNLVAFTKAADDAERRGSQWNVSAVYQRMDGQWRSIHAHFSLTTPTLKDAPALSSSP